MSEPIQVAIITTNYNHAPYIGEYVDSVISAKRNAEAFVGPISVRFLIADDASEDNSVDVMQGLREKRAARDVQLDLAFWNQKAGQNTLLNAMIQRGNDTGCEYAVILDADDCLAADYFSLTLPRLQQERAVNGKIGFVYTDLHFMKADRTPIRRGLFEDFSKAGTECGGFCMPTPALATMKCLVSGLAYDERLVGHINQNRYKKLCAEKGWAGIRIPAVGFHYRIHDRNVSNAHTLVYKGDGRKNRPIPPIYVRKVWANEVGGIA